MSDDIKPGPSTLTCALMGLGGAAVAYGAMYLFAGKTEKSKFGLLHEAYQHGPMVESALGKPDFHVFDYASEFMDSLRRAANGRHSYVHNIGHFEPDQPISGSYRVALYWPGSDPTVGIANPVGQVNYRPSYAQVDVQIRPDLTYRARLYPGNSKLTAQDHEQIARDVKELLSREGAAVERNRKWFTEKPWEQAIGLTPKQALSTLQSLGWKSLSGR
jgi:hypothetical protein